MVEYNKLSCFIQSSVRVLWSILQSFSVGVKRGLNLLRIHVQVPTKKATVDKEILPKCFGFCFCLCLSLGCTHVLQRNQTQKQTQPWHLVLVLTSLQRPPPMEQKGDYFCPRQPSSAKHQLQPLPVMGHYTHVNVNAGRKKNIYIYRSK